MSKFKKKYKWAKREEHFRSADHLLANIKPLRPILPILAHNDIERVKGLGLSNYLGIEMPTGKLSVIGQGGGAPAWFDVLWTGIPGTTIPGEY